MAALVLTCKTMTNNFDLFLENFSMSANERSMSKLFEYAVSAVTGIASAVVVGKLVFELLGGESKGSSSSKEPATISAELEAKLDENVKRLKNAKVIAILRLKNRDKAIERVKELVDMGYAVRCDVRGEELFFSS